MNKIIFLAVVIVMCSCKKQSPAHLTANGNTVAWKKINPAGTLPSGRGECSSVMDYNNHMFIFGGIGNSGNLNDLWSYSVTANSWTQLNPGGVLPAVRSLHTAVWDAVDSIMIVFGGNNTNLLNDLWSYSPSGNIWKQLSPIGTLPSARQGHTAVWDNTDSTMIVFGGSGSSGNLNDLWAYSPSRNSWVKINPSTSGVMPTPCIGQVAVWAGWGNGHQDEMIIFGGAGGITNKHMYAYGPGGNSWYDFGDSGTSWPGVRELSGISWVGWYRIVFIFGGTTNGSASGGLNDLWEWSDSWGSQGYGSGWFEVNATNTPSPRYGMASQIWGDGILIFGGIGKSGYLNELWGINVQ